MTLYTGVAPLTSLKEKLPPPRKAAAPTDLSVPPPPIAKDPGPGKSSDGISAQLGDLQKTIGGITGRVMKLEGESNGIVANMNTIIYCYSQYLSLVPFMDGRGNTYTLHDIPKGMGTSVDYCNEARLH